MQHVSKIATGYPAFRRRALVAIIGGVAIDQVEQMRPVPGGRGLCYGIASKTILESILLRFIGCL